LPIALKIFRGAHVSHLFRSFVALALMAHLVAIVAMAASPHWHEEAHHDADAPGHDCAVMLFLSGAADDAAPAPLLSRVELACVESVRMEAAQKVFLARRDGRIRDRAPPVAAA
jgi:hypothetical protein